MFTVSTYALPNHCAENNKTFGGLLLPLLLPWSAVEMCNNLEVITNKRKGILLICRFLSLSCDRGINFSGVDLDVSKGE